MLIKKGCDWAHVVVAKQQKSYGCQLWNYKRTLPKQESTLTEVCIWWNDLYVVWGPSSQNRERVLRDSGRSHRGRPEVLDRKEAYLKCNRGPTISCVRFSSRVLFLVLQLKKIQVLTKHFFYFCLIVNINTVCVTMSKCDLHVLIARVFKCLCRDVYMILSAHMFTAHKGMQTVRCSTRTWPPDGRVLHFTIIAPGSPGVSPEPTAVCFDTLEGKLTHSSGSRPGQCLVSRPGQCLPVLNLNRWQRLCEVTCGIMYVYVLYSRFLLSCA